jgi:hypothetical protein
MDQVVKSALAEWIAATEEREAKTLNTALEARIERLRIVHVAAVHARLVAVPVTKIVVHQR